MSGDDKAENRALDAESGSESDDDDDDDGLDADIEVEVALASGEWQQVTDAVSSRTYFHHLSSGMVVWNLQEELQRRKRMNTTTINEALSTGEWKQVLDEQTKAPYYYHVDTGVVCWELTEEEIINARTTKPDTPSDPPTSEKEEKEPEEPKAESDQQQQQQQQQQDSTSQPESQPSEVVASDEPPKPNFNPDLPGADRSQAALDSGDWSFDIDLHGLPFYTETSTGRTVRDLQLEMSQVIAKEKAAAKIYENNKLSADKVLSPRRESGSDENVDGPQDQIPSESAAWKSTDVNPLLKQNILPDGEENAEATGDEKENIFIPNPKVYVPNWELLTQSMGEGKTCPVTSTDTLRECFNDTNELYEDLKRERSVKAKPLRVRYDARKKWGDVVYAETDEMKKASEQARTRAAIHKQTNEEVESMKRMLHNKLDEIQPVPKPPPPVMDVVRPEVSNYFPPEQTITVRGFRPPASFEPTSVDFSALPPSPRICPVRSIQLLKREDWPRIEPQPLVNFFV
eukprot:TRINITY_DN1448_c0_g1_i2.p1 TRINITY_DN1448_c0_g1~~TRINITY_DN1448_c0_g1_i2.p1  ORF type:complete len:533 (+),score=129.75 TRINITY_DN1448_c0_g1_i2:57-1601(+)